MGLTNAIGALCGVVFSIIGAAVLFKDVRIQDYPKKWKEDSENRYVPELVRKTKTPEKKKEVHAEDEADQHVV